MGTTFNAIMLLNVTDYGGNVTGKLKPECKKKMYYSYSASVGEMPRDHEACRLYMSTRRQ